MSSDSVGFSSLTAQQKEALNKDSMLLIFDNCDEYIEQNPHEFKVKLQFLKKEYSQICVVLISEKCLNLDIIEYEHKIYVPPFDVGNSAIFLKTLSCTLIQAQTPIDRKKRPYWGINILEDFKELIFRSQGNS